MPVNTVAGLIGKTCPIPVIERVQECKGIIFYDANAWETRKKSLAQGLVDPSIKRYWRYTTGLKSNFGVFEVAPFIAMIVVIG